MKKTVTIGIPAFNEEKNILSLLTSLIKQKRDNFVLKQIIVACDGSTDQTATLVKEFSKSHSLVHLINDGKRLGTTARLNTFYKNLQTDILVTLDADITIKGNNVLKELVKPFADTHVGLVGGRVYPLSQHTIVGKILEAQEYFWSNVIDMINNGDNVHSHTGPISAGSKQFLKKVKRQKNIIASDHFLYFDAIKNKFIYKSARNARVYIKLPATFSDYMKQATRFLTSVDQLERYFGDWIHEQYAIPYTKKLHAYWKTLQKYPTFLPLALLLAASRKTFGFLYKEKSKNGLWTQVSSTK